MIVIENYATIAAVTKQQLEHYIKEEFGHVAFVQERQWAQPDWVLIKYESGEVATFCNIVLREVTIDGQTLKVAGINNVITPQAHRRKGYASLVLQEAEQLIFSKMNCAYGLLLCADALVPFYSRLGWHTLNRCSLYYTQPSGEQLYDSNVMLLSQPDQTPLQPLYINLNGLPW